MVIPVVAKKPRVLQKWGGKSSLLSWDLCKKFPEFTVLYIPFQYNLVTLSVRKEVVHSYICPDRHIKSPYTQMLMAKMFSWYHKLGGGVWITTSTVYCIESFKSFNILS